MLAGIWTSWQEQFGITYPVNQGFCMLCPEGLIAILQIQSKRETLFVKQTGDIAKELWEQVPKLGHLALNSTSVTC